MSLGAVLARLLAVDGMPHPAAEPDRFRHVVLRRLLATIEDVALLSGCALLSLGAFAALGWSRPAIAATLAGLFLAYFAGFLGAVGATPGMRRRGLCALDRRGRAPSLARALLHTVLFYAAGLVLGPLILATALLEGRRRFLHDILAGLVVVRCRPGGLRRREA